MKQRGKLHYRLLFVCVCLCLSVFRCVYEHIVQLINRSTQASDLLTQL